MMKSLTRSSRRARSCATMPARAWERWLSQVVKPLVSPPMTEPASAEIADIYAVSMIRRPSASGAAATAPGGGLVTGFPTQPSHRLGHGMHGRAGLGGRVDLRAPPDAQPAPAPPSGLGA